MRRHDPVAIYTPIVRHRCGVVAAVVASVSKNFGDQAHGGGLAVSTVLYSALPGAPGAGVVLSQSSAPTGPDVSLFAVATALPHTLGTPDFPDFDASFLVSFDPSAASVGAKTATFHLALNGVPFDLVCTANVT